MAKTVALVWDDRKAYFFKGDEYTRYDVAADRADEGYPQSISAWGLPFDGGGTAQPAVPDDEFRWRRTQLLANTRGVKNMSTSTP
jgi:Hemopexin